MKSTKVVVSLTVAVAAISGLAGPASADSANGTWLRDNGAHVLAFDCGGGLGLKVVKSPEPAKVGKTIMCGGKKTSENKWKGTVLNLDDGQKYSGYVSVSGGSLTLSGCVLGGIICKNDTWSRIK
ncbi:MAG: DUF2147 domain-containing protein [Hyphomicrobium sp.]|nr:DUF2147 domain-containing protein [Hyphomicrobium sp.]